MVTSLLKLNNKGKVYIEIMHFPNSEQEKISSILKEITSETPDEVVRELFKDCKCTVKTKGDIKKQKNKYKYIMLGFYAVMILLTLVYCYLIL